MDTLFTRRPIMILILNTKFRRKIEHAYWCTEKYNKCCKNVCHNHRNLLSIYQNPNLKCWLSWAQSCVQIIWPPTFRWVDAWRRSLFRCFREAYRAFWFDRIAPREWISCKYMNTLLKNMVGLCEWNIILCQDDIIVVI